MAQRKVVHQPKREERVAGLQTVLAEAAQIEAVFAAAFGSERRQLGQRSARGADAEIRADFVQVGPKTCLREGSSHRNDGEARGLRHQLALTAIGGIFALGNGDGKQNGVIGTHGKGNLLANRSHIIERKLTIYIAAEQNAVCLLLNYGSL